MAKRSAIAHEENVLVDLTNFNGYQVDQLDSKELIKHVPPKEGYYGEVIGPASISIEGDHYDREYWLCFRVRYIPQTAENRTMKITVTHHVGDMLAESSASAMVHGCNVYGVMGSGIAATIKERFPSAYQAYRKQFSSKGLLLGSHSSSRESNQHGAFLLYNLVTQPSMGTAGRHVDYGAIATGFKDIITGYPQPNQRNKTLAIPLIGAGLGGGNWALIIQLILEMMKEGGGSRYDTLEIWYFTEKDRQAAIQSIASQLQNLQSYHVGM